MSNNTFPEDAPWFNIENTTKMCKVVDVYDGDTVTIIFEFENKYYKTKCRLYGIDTPELRNKETKESAILARDCVRNIILNKVVQINFKKEDKYGRILGDIYYNDLHINKYLVQEGHAKEYFGGKK